MFIFTNPQFIQVATTKYHRWGDSNRNLFYQFWRWESPRIIVPVADEDTHPASMSSHDRERKSSGILSYKDNNPVITLITPCNLKYFYQGHISKQNHVWARVPTYGLQWKAKISSQSFILPVISTFSLHNIYYVTEKTKISGC